MRSSQATAKIT